MESSSVSPSVIEDIQLAVFNCDSINNNIEKLYRETKTQGFIPGGPIEDNIDNLVERCVKITGSVLNLLKVLGKFEGNKDKSGYTYQYWDVLDTWYRYNKPKEEQREFVEWLKSLDPKLNPSQKIKLTAMLQMDVNDNETKRITNNNFSLYLIVRIDNNEWCIGTCKAYRSGKDLPDTNGFFSIPFNKGVDLEQQLIVQLNNYIDSNLRSIPDFPSNFELLVDVEYMYSLYPENWVLNLDRNYLRPVGHRAVVTFKQPMKMTDVEKENRKNRREKYHRQEPRSGYWIDALETSVLDMLNEDENINFVLCHKKPTTFDIMRDFLLKFPYALFIRRDMAGDSEDCKRLKELFLNLNDNFPLQLQYLRDKYKKEIQSHPLQHVALVWDDELYHSDLIRYYWDDLQKKEYH